MATWEIGTKQNNQRTEDPEEISDNGPLFKS